MKVVEMCIFRWLCGNILRDKIHNMNEAWNRVSKIKDN